MDTKLTLTIEKDVIEKAKDYARKRRRSLSDLIENYLKYIVSSKEKENIDEITPMVKSMMGSFKVPKDYNYKKALVDGLNKKYSK
ncbi:MAG: hypothetical protein HGB12_05785 [Bacteroidetes bacterium]|nr:hypothetical protein [Bacteroidota bacterium]